MALWFTLLGANLLIAGIMIGGGLFMTRATLAYRPGRVQRVGYRTPRSQKNADTWEFANRYFGRTILAIGRVALPGAAVAMLPALPGFGRSETFVESWGAAVAAVLIVAILVAAFMTERALRATFTQRGTRKASYPRSPAPTGRTRQATRRTRH